MAKLSGIKRQAANERTEALRFCKDDECKSRNIGRQACCDQMQCVRRKSTMRSQQCIVGFGANSIRA